MTIEGGSAMRTVGTRIAYGLVDQFPDEGRALRSVVRRARLQKNLSLDAIRTKLNGSSWIDPGRVYHIDPFRIEYATTIAQREGGDWEDWVFPHTGAVDRVQSGDWDRMEKRVSEMRVIEAIEQRVHEGVHWSSTDYFQHAVRQIETGRSLWGCRTRADFERHCDRVDHLTEAIQTQGYIERPRTMAKFGREEEVLINLSRDGQALFQDGRHRLAIARALRLTSIPVQVHVRHSEWVCLRRLLERMAHGPGGASQSGLLYQPAVHFDLADIPAAHGCDDRWSIVEPALPKEGGGEVLDLGTNLGAMCHRFEDRGYEATGVECLPEVAYAARRIAKSERRKFRVINADLLNSASWSGFLDRQYRIVLALNIFHHFLKKESEKDRLVRFLSQTRPEYLFFEAHNPKEVQMNGAFMNPDPSEFAELVRGWAGLSKVETLGETSDGRCIFRIE